MSFPTSNIVPIGEIQRATYKGQLMKNTAVYGLLCNEFPVTITNAVDGLCQQRANIANQKEKDKITKLIGMLSELKTDVMTNKPLKPLKVSYNNQTIVFDDEIKKNIDQLMTWYDGHRLLLESYLYWKMHHFVLKTCRSIDPFDVYKRHAQGEGLNLRAVVDLATVVMADVELTEDKLKPTFMKLMQACLWSARTRLSPIVLNEDPVDDEDLTGICLADDSSRLWTFLWKKERNDLPIGIVINNTGYELFTDLCLATFFIKAKMTDKINFYGKVIPWHFGVMRKDLAIAVRDAKGIAASSSMLNEMFDLWNLYILTGQFSNIETTFWSLPDPISDLEPHYTRLHEECRKSQVLILKGNFAYSKLVSDRVTPETLLFSQIVRKYAPNLTIASIRVLKTDLFCGLDQRLLNQARISNPNWNLTDRYGAIQFHDLKRYI